MISSEPLVTRLTLPRRDLLLLGIIPADIEETVALGTPHAGRSLLERSPGATVRAHTIARPPRHRQSRGVWRARNDAPARWWSRQDLERGPRTIRQRAVHVEHGVRRCQAYHAVPGAAPQSSRLGAPQPRPLPLGHRSSAEGGGPRFENRAQKSTASLSIADDAVHDILINPVRR